MPHYSPSLHFRQGRACWPARMGAPRGARVRACWPAGPRPCPAWGSRALSPTWLRQPALLASLCSPFSGVFPFLDRYISLAQNIGYVNIKPMTKYCPVFMLSFSSVQQDRNSGLSRNYGAAIREKSVQ